MKGIGRLGLIVAVLMLAGAAGAATRIVTVQDVVDYTANVWDDDVGVWFIVPEEIFEDHWPWHRGSNQDWGWTHDVTRLVPADANGIESATLTILSWDVDSGEGEDDVITVNDRYLGMLTGVDRDWKPVTFTLPAPVLDELWRDKKLSVYMDIDQMLELANGYRVTLKNSTLSIKYITSGTAPVVTTIPVFRFWSPALSSHFYTMNEEERDGLIANYPDVWTYEGIAYKALAGAGSTSARPVHRFWSPALLGHFYTMNEQEKQWLQTTYPDVWTYEGIAFYAYAAGEQPGNALPVYRFWSPVLNHHFYTISETEKQGLIANYSQVWTYEGIAWYAFPKE